MVCNLRRACGCFREVWLSEAGQGGVGWGGGVTTEIHIFHSPKGRSATYVWFGQGPSTSHKFAVIRAWFVLTCFYARVCVRVDAQRKKKKTYTNPICREKNFLSGRLAEWQSLIVVIMGSLCHCR